MGSKQGGAQGSIMSMEVVKYVKKNKLYVWHCDNNGQYTQSSLLSPVSNILYQNRNQEDHYIARALAARRRGEVSLSRLSTPVKRGAKNECAPCGLLFWQCCLLYGLFISTFKVQFGAQIWRAPSVTLIVIPSLDLRSEWSYGNVVTKNRYGLI